MKKVTMMIEDGGATHVRPVPLNCNTDIRTNAQRSVDLRVRVMSAIREAELCYPAATAVTIKIQGRW